MKRVELARSEKPMKRTPLRRVSKKRAAANRRGKRAARATDYLDCQGVAFSVHHLFTDRAAKVEIVRNGCLLRFMHERFPECMNCGAVVGMPGVIKIDAHHISWGAARSDVRTDIFMACKRWDGEGCHELAKTSRFPQGAVIYKKWLADPDGTDWVLLARLLGLSRLPDLVTT